MAVAEEEEKDDGVEAVDVRFKEMLPSTKSKASRQLSAQSSFHKQSK